MNIAVNKLINLKLLQKSYIKSPLNYTGGKYKLLNQIMPYFPEKIDTFVDLFAGGCNVAINVNANKVIANDISKQTINLFEYFKANTIEKIEKEITQTIKKYNLSQSFIYGYEYYNTNSKDGLATYNRKSYLKLRDDYNQNPNPIMFYVLIIFAFNNQIRFNKSGKFNLPVNKRDFTLSMQKNLKHFMSKLEHMSISFISQDFRDVEIAKNSFVYIDPPYLATTASYNENGGWNETLESELLCYIDKLDNKGIKFALSNVLESKGIENQLLIAWCKSKNYKVNYLNFSYNNCNYQTKNRDKNSTVEVLITNY